MATFSDIAAYAVEKGRSLGYSDAAIAGILGNIFGETSGKAKGGREHSFNSAGGGWGAYGITQVRGSRLEGLAKFAGVELDKGKRGSRAAIPDISYKTQVDYMFHELETTHKSVGKAIKGATDPKVAAKTVMEKFERPSQTHQLSSFSTRSRAAQGLFDARFNVTEKAAQTAQAAQAASSKSQSLTDIAKSVNVNYAHPERGHWSKGLEDQTINSIAMMAQAFPNQTLTSAHRSRSNPVEARKGPNAKGTHTLGLAYDFDLTGLTNEQRSKAVQTARMSGATRVGAYSRQPNMLHVDFKPGFAPQKGQTVYSMFDESKNNMSRAPGWFTEGLTTTKGIPTPTARPDYQPDRGPMRDNPMSAKDSFIASIATTPVTASATLGLNAAAKNAENRGLAAIENGLLGAEKSAGKAEGKESSAAISGKDPVSEEAALAAESIASIATSPSVAASAKASVESLAGKDAASKGAAAPSLPTVDLSQPGPMSFEFDSLIGSLANDRAEKAAQSSLASQKDDLADQQQTAAESGKKGGVEGFLGELGKEIDGALSTIGGFFGIGKSKDKDAKDGKGVFGGVLGGLFSSLSKSLDGFSASLGSGAFDDHGNWGDLGMTPGGTSQVTNATAAPGRGPGDIGWSAGDTTGANHSNGGRK